MAAKQIAGACVTHAQKASTINGASDDVHASGSVIEERHQREIKHAIKWESLEHLSVVEP